MFKHIIKYIRMHFINEIIVPNRWDKWNRKRNHIEYWNLATLKIALTFHSTERFRLSISALAFRFRVSVAFDVMIVRIEWSLGNCGNLSASFSHCCRPCQYRVDATTPARRLPTSIEHSRLKALPVRRFEWRMNERHMSHPTIKINFTIHRFSALLFPLAFFLENKIPKEFNFTENHCNSQNNLFQIENFCRQICQS